MPRTVTSLAVTVERVILRDALRGSVRSLVGFRPRDSRAVLVPRACVAFLVGASVTALVAPSATRANGSVSTPMRTVGLLMVKLPT